MTRDRQITAGPEIVGMLTIALGGLLTKWTRIRTVVERPLRAGQIGGTRKKPRKLVDSRQIGVYKSRLRIEAFLPSLVLAE